MKMFSHDRVPNGKDEWLTPPEIIHALGPFDLDPCAPIDPPWKTARHKYDIRHDGLSQDWFGRVWCNPPYGKEAGKWLDRLAFHNDGIGLIFARTETAAFFSAVWDKADGALFLRGRLKFYHVDGTQAESSAGAPSVLVAYGLRNVEALRNSGIEGQLVTNWRAS